MNMPSILRNLRRQVNKEPMALVSLLIAVTFGLLNSNWFWKLFEETLEVTILVAKDAKGRCVDGEMFLENKSEEAIKNIRASVEADFLTKRGDVELVYATLRDLMVASGEKTRLDRRAELPIYYEFDTDNLVLSIPHLNPGEWMHFKFVEIGSDGLKRQAEMIRRGEEGFLHVPRFGLISHDHGRADVNYILQDGCSRR